MIKVKRISGFADNSIPTGLLDMTAAAFVEKYGFDDLGDGEYLSNQADGYNLFTIATLPDPEQPKVVTAARISQTFTNNYMKLEVYERHTAYDPRTGEVENVQVMVIFNGEFMGYSIGDSFDDAKNKGWLTICEDRKLDPSTGIAQMVEV